MESSANRQRSYSFAALLPRAKAAAQGRWLELITTLTSCSPDAFNVRKKPCPKCGGNDRFRAFDDFNQEGGVVCSQCHDKNNRDGFATIQWLNGWTFPDTVRAVAQYLGLVDSPAGSARIPAAKKPTPTPAPTNQGKGLSDKPAPDSALEFQQWNDSLAAIWCMKKKPITVAALKSFGARIARYKTKKQHYTVIALPIWGPQLDQASPVGWIVYNATGGTLPSKDGPVPKKATWGSKPGVVGPADQLRDKTNRKIKTEGPTDGLALLPLVDKATTAVFCNAYGANENPDKEELNWLPSLVEGSPSFLTIGDADKAGEDGVAKWSNYFAQFGPSSIVRLPYEVVPSHGKDLRDFFNEGNGRPELEALFAAAEPVKFIPPQARRAFESPEDPHRLARANLEAYRSEHGGELRYWRGQWLKWKHNRYQFLTREEIDAKVNARIKLEFDKQWEVDYKRHQELSATDPDYDEDPPNARKVTAPIVRDTMAALRSMCTISSSVEMGTWIQSKEQRKYLACHNCILDIQAFTEDAPPEKVFLAHSPNWFSTACLNYSFDPNAGCPIWLPVLNDLIGDDPDKLLLAQEFAGYILSPANNRSKFLALEGEGGRGKSVFVNALMAIVGNENTSSVDLEAIGKRFQSFPTLGKMVNFCNEANDVEGPAESFLKRFTGGNPLMFEDKGNRALPAMPTAKLVLTWNIAPRFKDKSEGLWRRLLVLKFNRKPKNPNPALLEPDYWKANGQLPGMLNWALLGLRRLEANGDFTIPGESKDAAEEIRTANNSARSFIKETYSYREGAYIPCSQAYEDYSKWCNDHGMSPVNSNNFGRELKQVFNDLVDRKKVTTPILGRVQCYVNLEQGAEDETF